MTPAEIELARHALGLPNKRKTSYRNHFVTGEGSADHGAWLNLVKNGDATRRAGSALTGGNDLFRLTRAGALAALKDLQQVTDLANAHGGDERNRADVAVLAGSIGDGSTASTPADRAAAVSREDSVTHQLGHARSVFGTAPRGPVAPDGAIHTHRLLARSVDDRHAGQSLPGRRQE